MKERRKNRFIRKKIEFQRKKRKASRSPGRFCLEKKTNFALRAKFRVDLIKKTLRIAFMCLKANFTTANHQAILLLSRYEGRSPQYCRGFSCRGSLVFAGVESSLHKRCATFEWVGYLAGPSLIPSSWLAPDFLVVFKRPSQQSTRWSAIDVLLKIYSWSPQYSILAELLAGAGWISFSLRPGLLTC